MKIIGIDPSLTGTGLAFPDGSTQVLQASKHTGLERLVDLRDRLRGLVCSTRPDVAVIEDYAWGMPHSSIMLGEWGGVMRVMLWELGVDLVFVNPSHLKLFQLGRPAKAKDEPKAPKKDQAMSAISAQSGISFATNDHMDAWSLAALGYAYVGEHWIKRTAEQLSALSAICWPVCMVDARSKAGLPPIQPPGPKRRKK